MSYVATNFYQNPGPPYVGSDIDEPVPGWGLAPNMAGGKMVGVGQLKFSPAAAQHIVTRESEGFPAWYYVAGAVAIAGVAALAWNMGWIG